MQLTSTVHWRGATAIGALVFMQDTLVVNTFTSAGRYSIPHIGANITGDTTEGEAGIVVEPSTTHAVGTRNIMVCATDLGTE